MDGFQSQDLIHLIYTKCTGFSVELLLAQRGLCRDDEHFPFQLSLLQRKQGIAVMCSSVDSRADIRRNRKNSWQMKQT